MLSFCPYLQGKRMNDPKISFDWFHCQRFLIACVVFGLMNWGRVVEGWDSMPLGDVWKYVLGLVLIGTLLSALNYLWCVLLLKFESQCRRHGWRQFAPEPSQQRWHRRGRRLARFLKTGGQRLRIE